MAVADRRAKDSAMAQHMKKDGVTRTSMKCPMCHSIVSINGLFGHLGQCGRSSKSEPKK